MKKILFLFTYGTLSLVIASTLVFSSFAVPVKKVSAGGGGFTGGALEITQQRGNLDLAISAVKDTVTAGATTLTAGATTELLIKENLLDGIGWAIAKQMVSSMTSSLINWINSGFEGSPAFITDLQAHLLSAVDSVVGTYIKNLGGIGEFICSPFRLDVQAALSINYAQARSGMPSGPSACTLSGIGENIENFLEGSMSGWDQWFKVTSNPQNTPYGAYLEAEAKLNARIINAAGQEIEIANWGAGFLSKKVCEPVAGSAEQKCTISTPGTVIEKALTFQLSTGPRALIEADEINEIIGALMNQLVQKAVGGINGLLGLGGNSRYNDYSYSDTPTTQTYTEAMESEGTPFDPVSMKNQLVEQLATERSYINLIDNTIANADIFLSGGGGGGIGIASSSVINLRAGVASIRPSVEAKITTLDSILATYNGADAAATPTRTADTIRREAMLQYVDLYRAGVFSKKTDVEVQRVEWRRVLVNII